MPLVWLGRVNEPRVYRLYSFYILQHVTLIFGPLGPTITATTLPDYLLSILNSISLKRIKVIASRGSVSKAFILVVCTGRVSTNALFVPFIPL